MTIDDRELDRRLDALTSEVEADESLWPGIERRLLPARRWPAVAAVVAALGLGFMFVALSLYDNAAVEHANVAQTEAAAMRSAAPGPLAVSSIDATPSLLEAWHENQSAIEQLEHALDRDPGNRLLLDFLTQARLRQARLIRQGLSTSERSITL